MGFFSTLLFVRPGPPPSVTGRELARFLERFYALRVTAETPGSAQVKFGRSIDQNSRALSEQVPILKGEYCSISETRTQPLDIECASYATPPAELVPRLLAADRSIYRAYVSLGASSADLFNAMKFDTPLNNDSFRPDSWGFEAGPIRASSLTSDAHRVGWIAISLSGYGYCYPRSVREIVETARRQGDVQRVEALCRETWPASGKHPSFMLRRARNKMGELWPYERTDVPVDWFWTISETG